MRYIMLILFVVIVGFLALPLACTSRPELSDGEWIGRTPPTADGYRGEIRVVVRGGRIVGADCVIIDAAVGKNLDASYAEILGEGIEADLAGLATYSAALLREQDVAKVDVLPSAPWSHSFFVDAAIAAIAKARRAAAPLGLADGVYKAAEAEPDGEGYLTRGSLTVAGGRITEASVVIDDTIHGRPFDGTYEEIYVNNEFYIDQCRADWAGLQGYLKDLLAQQRLDSVDAVSGATWSYEKFKLILEKAIAGAE